MHILYLTEEPISYSEPMVRGGQIHVRNVVTGLRRRGHTVSLIDWNDTPECSYQYSLAPRLRFGVDPVRTVTRAISIGRSQNVDVIVSKTRKVYLPGLVAASALGVPHIVHVGSSPKTSGIGVGHRIGALSFSARLRAPHDAYFVVCRSIGDELSSHGIPRGRMFNVSNAVDTDRFHPEGPPEPLAKQYQDRLPGDEQLTLGFVGGLHKYKGLDDLAVALEGVTTNCRLLVAGDGPERARLEGRFDTTAVFLGAVPYTQIPALYHEIDILVLPSHTEGLPRVVLEAQATGTPVVATRVGGVSEVIDDGRTGLLCNPHDPTGLAAAIDRLDDADLRTRLGRDGRATVVQQYTWDQLYERYETALERVV